MLQQRSSGVLAHISSLPSEHGIGDIGISSRIFLDFLAEADQSCWQFLPTGPTHPLFDHSPYMSLSAFAGSTLLLSPELLHADGLLSLEDLTCSAVFSPYTTDFIQVTTHKQRLLQMAFRRFDPAFFAGYQQFLADTDWLEDYALFMSLKNFHQGKGWFDWPRKLATREPQELAKFTAAHQQQIDYYRFEQFIFFRQWQEMRAYAAKLGIALFGDLPIYVGYDSADVWAHQEIFSLDRKSLRPLQVSGVPPDYFSETGQRWGNPLYDWQNSSPKIQADLLDWWCRRLAHLFTMVDIARIDHFRGFESYWAIPEENPTALEGEWLPGPGKPFFAAVEERLGPLNIVAEDLGIITPEVEKLRDELHFPGMKILQFAFDGNIENSYLPYNYATPNCIVYTGTHDNETTVGWFLSDRLDDRERARIRKLANRQPTAAHGVHHDLIYLAQSSISALCIFPLQDILGFGNDCKMNSPGVAEGNWRWRCAGEFLSKEVSRELAESTRLFGRGRQLPRPESFKKNGKSAE